MYLNILVLQHPPLPLQEIPISSVWGGGDLHNRVLKLTHLKSSWAPVHKLNCPLSLDGGNGSIDIFGYNITSIQQTACHVLAMTRITFYHLVCWFKASIGYLSHTELFMVSLLSRDDRGICSQREVNSWIRHQVGLKFQNIWKLN